MISSKGISKKSPHPSLDFKRLRQEGIDLIQTLSGDEWTDYNLHDPGVTTLEILCYGLTELGYRSRLLDDAFQTERLTQAEFVEKYFFKADEVLDVLPLTKLDFEDFTQRSHWQVLQAWFVEYPIFSSANVVQGGYEIALLLKDDARYGNLNTDVILIPFEEANGILEVIIFDPDNRRFIWKDLQQIVGCRLDEEESDNFIVFENYNCQVSLTLEVIYQNRTQSEHIQTKARIALSQPSRAYKKSFSIELHKAGIIQTLESREFLNAINATLEKEKYKAGILGSVKQTLLPVRNLCEDFVSLRVVNTQELKLEAEIILDDYAPQASVMIHRVYDHLDAYLLQHVIRSKREGSGKEHILYGSNLIEEMVKIEGIVAARIISLNLFIDGIPTISLRGETSFECISLQQFSYYVPIIARGKSDIRFIRSDVVEKTGEQYSREETASRGFFVGGQTQETKGHPEQTQKEAIESRFFESLREYYSIQKHFPENYRLNENPGSANTGESINLRTKQFKTYLLLFERIMIDYLDKLYHFNDLLSVKQGFESSENELERLKNQLPHIEALNLIDERRWNDVISSAKDIKTQLLRKHQIVDHLLARFATTISPLGHPLDSVDDISGALAAKTSLLQNVPMMTRERGLGIPIKHEEEVWNSDLLSGFQKRIYLLLGLNPDRLKHVQLSNIKANEPFGFYLVEHILLVRKDEKNIINKKFNNAADLLYDYIIKMSTQYQKYPAYSFQVSIVLPNWYRDWRNQKTRIESIIHEELPAHILPHFHWLNKKNMATFESCYEDWLKALLQLNSLAESE
jgi:hypothetical protein